MKARTRPSNVVTLKKALVKAEEHGYAIGSFSPRYTPLIVSVLRAAENTSSPAIVQISHKELVRYGITPDEFAHEFYSRIISEQITVPLVLHLDHTKDLEIIAQAIEAGFTSVMIDASEKLLDENIAITREVVNYAHSKGVSVEAELGMIGTTDFVETDKDEELYTDPHEAHRFVNETQVDALAVSCGTAHGVYLVRQPRIDYPRLMAIRKLAPVHLVLHGGSGVPAEMMAGAIHLQGGGVSKVNIATDLELSFLSSIGREERMSNEECKALAPEVLERGRSAVENQVMDKIIHFLGSAQQANKGVI